jgi:hypothetical protein
MADWSTVVIAAITALAGMGGSIIAGRYNLRVLSKTHRRDDAAQFRHAVDALFLELDAVPEASSRQVPLALTMANGALPERSLEPVNLGRVRAIVTLYFPDLHNALDTLSERENAATVALRTSIQKGVNPLVAGGQFALEQSVYVSALCRDLRESLPEKAKEIGASVRESVQ